jgi:UDP-glucose 4-epimerase
MRIFECCARLNIPVVYLSSSIVYGEQPYKPITENATLFPGTIYGVCKVACENFLKVLGDGYGLEWTVLRLFATYGAGHTPNFHQGIVNVILTQLMSGNKLIIKGSLGRVRDIVYIEDSARAIVDILFCGNARGKILNVGTGIGATVENIIEVLCEELDRKKEDLDIRQAEPVVGDPHYNVADITQLINLIEFKPEYDLRAGLKKLVFSRSNDVSC